MAMRLDGGGRTSGSRSAKGGTFGKNSPTRSSGGRSAKGGTFGTKSPKKPIPTMDFSRIGKAAAQTVQSAKTRQSVQNAKPPAPRRNSGGGGGGGYSGGGGGGGGFSGGYDGGGVAPNAFGAVAEIAPPAAPTDDEWWNSDSGFQAEQGSLKTSLDNALANLTQQRTGYDTDFMTTLKNLGWGWGDNTKLDGFEKGAFDAQNQLGAYGQGLTGLNNDFASRGLMDSSFFADALTDFNTDMNNQYQNLVGGRNQFRNERQADEQAANNEYQQALARARAESLARRDAQYGIV